MKKYLFLLIATLLVAGCASHNVVKPASLITSPSAYEKKVSKDGVDFFCTTYVGVDEVKQYFGEDLIWHKILPMQVVLSNKSDETLVIDRQSIMMIDPDGKECQPLSIDEVIRKAKKSYLRSGGWGVAFGAVGLGISAYNVHKTNKKVQADYESRILEDGNLVPGAVSEGFLFFPIDASLETLEGYSMSVGLRNVENGKTFFVKYDMSGDVPKRIRPTISSPGDESPEDEDDEW